MPQDWVELAASEKRYESGEPVHVPEGHVVTLLVCELVELQM